jgi:hypothetical protein
MTTAAEFSLNWTETRMGASADRPLPRFVSPQEVAERLFDELGLHLLLEEALAECDPLVREVAGFSQGPAHADADAGEGPSQADVLTDDAPIETGNAMALATGAPDPAAAGLALETAALAAEDEGYFVEVPFMTDERYEREGAWMSDRADAADDSWLGVDPSQPREWTPDDLMMLIYRDRARVSEAAARLAGIEHEGADDAEGYTRAA